MLGRARVGHRGDAVAQRLGVIDIEIAWFAQSLQRLGDERDGGIAIDCPAGDDERPRAGQAASR